MINLFLKAKHWQLFSLMTVLPFFFQFFFLLIAIANIESSPDTKSDFSVLIVIPWLMLIISGVYFGWLWSIAIGLQKNIPHELRLNVKTFKSFFLSALAYIVLLSIFLIIYDNLKAVNGKLNEADFAVIIVPLHLFSMFCIGYSMYFVAKTIKTAELQRKAVWGDYAGEFFQLWFYPIGVWLIQPRVNSLYASQIETKSEEKFHNDHTT